MNYNDSNIQEININSMLRRVDLNLLLIFDVLMQEQNVSKAAERVFLSQPAMSNALNRLREMFDDPILIRGSKGMQPTPRAKALEAPIRSILQQIAHTVQPAAPFDPSTSQSRFVIGMNDYGENIVFPELTSRLNQIAPNVELVAQMLTTENLEPLLENGELNVVIGVEEYFKTTAKLTAEGWIDERLVCVVNKSHLLAQRKRLSLDQYLTLKHVYPSPLGLRKNIVEIWLAEQKRERSIAVTTRSYWAAAQVITKSDYILSLPLRVANILTQQMPLHILEPPKDFPGFRLNLVTHSLYEKDAGTQWILQQLRTLVL